MNISITKTIILIVGAILLIAGAWFGIEAIRSADIVKGLFALAGIVIGYALVSGKGVSLSQ